MSNNIIFLVVLSWVPKVIGMQLFFDNHNATTQKEKITI